jgi:hypothetical protein
VLDSNVAYFGNTLTNQLDAVEGKDGKAIERGRLKVLGKWFPNSTTQFYQDPARR